MESLTFIKIRYAIPPRSRTLRQISSSFKWQNFKALQSAGQDGIGMAWKWSGDHPGLGFGHCPTHT